MNKKVILKALPFLLAFLLPITMFAGCQAGEKSGGAVNSSDSSGTTQGQGTASPAAQSAKLPIADKPIEIQVFDSLHPNASAAGIKDYSEVYAIQELEKLTNIKVKWICPASQQETEAYNLMISSGDLPDVIVRYWGADVLAGAVSDEVIIPIDDLIDKVAPNIKEQFEIYPVAKKQTTYDDGHVYYLPQIMSPFDDGNLHVACIGYTMRRDWLEKVKLPPPDTTEDWYNVFKAFKQQFPDCIPYTSRGLGSWDTFAFDCFGTKPGFFPDGGTIKYGPVEPEYFQALEYANRLYKEKLLDPDFLTNNWDQVYEKMLTGKAGCTFIFPVDKVTNFKLDPELKAKDPGYDMWIYDYPKAPDGKRYLGNSQFVSYNRVYGAAITSKSKYAEEIMKWFDWQHSREGWLLMNYGEEGKDYTLNSKGNPVRTDFVLANPDGLSSGEVIAKRTMSLVAWPYRVAPVDTKDPDWIKEQTADWGGDLGMFNELIAVENRGDTSHILPPVMFTTEESKVLAQKMTEINNLVTQKRAQFITGEAPLTEFEGYVEQLKRMGIEEVVKIYQDAFDRYNAK